ncbi:MAG TPA: endolytic transglycosylase MltG, partial [Dermatophilaceae bacterium]|nr:endolytic transglycosylase MltG [Dermatophilaceae bacterium]
MKRRHLGSSIFGDGPSDDPAQEGADVPEVAPASRRDGRRRSERVRVRGIRRLVVLLVTLGLVAGAGGVAAFVLWPMVSGLTASNDYTGVGKGTASVVVHGGDTSRTIATALEKAGVVKTAKAFGDAAAGDSRSGSIQPGSYAVRTNMSAASALAMLLDPVNRTVPRVTIREGLWVSEVIAVLSAATHQPLDDYQVALKD